jgi:choline dehydrogenase-like flavoprotein
MNRVETDVCIIGSGMGGGTLALRLAEKGLRPLLIEAGGLQESASTMPCEQVGRGFGLEKSRSIELGGTSNLWHGVAAPLDRRDFDAARTNEDGRWPISYESMCEYWSEALGFLGFGDCHITHFEKLAPNFAGLADDIKFNRDFLTPKLFRVMKRPKRLKADLLHAVGLGRIQLMLGVTALEFLPARDNITRTDRLAVGQGATRVEIKAKRFVLCAGALETPRILQNSSMFGPGGLGNDRGFVGRFLMDHPMGFLGKISFKSPVRAPLFSDVREKLGNRYRIGVVPADSPELLNSNLYMRPAIPGATRKKENDVLLSLIAVRKMRDLSFRNLRDIFLNPRVIYRIIANRYALPIRYKAADLFFVTEQSPTSESRVTLSEMRDIYGYPLARIDWRVSDVDVENVGHFIDELTKAGLVNDQYVFDELPSVEKWRETFTSAAHHLGTARMSADSASGVVDENLKIYGVDNVWICDGSVFPTVGNANPSLTIAALALRLADHLTKGIVE